MAKFGGVTGTYGGSGELVSLVGPVTIDGGTPQQTVITNVVATGGWPPESQYERLFMDSMAGGNVIDVQNLHTSGYSAYVARGSDGRQYYAAGYGNISSLAIFAGRTYIESFSGMNAAGLPKAFVFALDGDYGRSGATGQFRFYQRYTIDHLGTHFWKGVDYANTQVETVRVTEGGDFALLKNVVPNAIDVPVGAAAMWFDKTAGTPVIKFLARDANGALFDASVSMAAYTKTASDTFTAADNASSVSGGRAADVGGNWAGADADNWGVASNKAYRSSGTADSAVWIDTNLTDVTVEANITLSAVRACAGLVVRGVDANNFVYVQMYRQGANDKIQALQKVAGVFTELSRLEGGTFITGNLTLGSTYNLRCGIVGNSLLVYLDGVYKGRFETTALSSGDKQGFMSFIGATEDDGGTRWDNFIVTP